MGRSPASPPQYSSTVNKGHQALPYHLRAPGTLHGHHPCLYPLFKKNHMHLGHLRNKDTIRHWIFSPSQLSHVIQREYRNKAQQLGAGGMSDPALGWFQCEAFQYGSFSESLRTNGAIRFCQDEFPMTNDIGSSVVVVTECQYFSSSKAWVGQHGALMFLGTFVSNFANTVNVLIFVALWGKYMAFSFSCWS